MARFTGDKTFQHGKAPGVGVLLVNLGSPDAPEPPSVRRFLREFLLDPRIVEIPRPIWWLILHAFVLPTRPRAVSEAYASIWTDRGSPLTVFSTDLAAGVGEQLRARFGDNIAVELAMRYGDPSVADAMERLRSRNLRRLVVLPLYPQYAAATSGSVFDAVAATLAEWRWVPELRFISDYFDNPAYIGAVADSVRRHRAELGAGELLLFSFHGLPRSVCDDGDPYRCQCYATARLVAQELDLAEDQWEVSFQSRFGKQEWLKPYADIRLEELGQAGVKRIDMCCPGFAVDCLETLEEIAIRGQETFAEHGGEALRYIPALNADDAHAAALAGLIERAVKDWPELEADTPEAVAEREAARQRALALGAPE
ncbi:MAG: ferrochelatase [Gammaproteobacteria bacterium]|nr:ferrochelatase [Gammaproteobacteria bacterium]